MSASRYDRLMDLLLSGEGQRIRDQDQLMRSRELVSTFTILTSNSSRLTDIGPLITRTDREIRRAAVILGADNHAEDASYRFGVAGPRPRPLAPSRGGLRVTDADARSLHLLVEAFGDVASMLTAQPVAAFIAVVTLCQYTATFRTWLRRRKRELEGVDAERILDVLKPFKSDMKSMMHGDPPDLELEIRPARDERLHAINRPEDTQLREKSFVAEAAMKVGRDIQVRGSKIIHIRKYADGTEDILYVET